MSATHAPQVGDEEDRAIMALEERLLDLQRGVTECMTVLAEVHSDRLAEVAS